jgi:sugar O-acyltransferase (sialic acid O-acetyltransferase NeuD family)
MDVAKDVYPVGRLDYDSEGLLFLINDTKMNHQLLHPSFEHKRTYWVQVEGNITIEATKQLAKGVSINVNSCIAGHCKIDDFVFINRNVSIGHHTVIGKYTTINPGVNIAGNVTIGEECLIGIGANIIDGVKIGNNVIIGAGSLVTKDIPNNVVVYGTPCKIIRNNET